MINLDKVKEKFRGGFVVIIIIAIIILAGRCFYTVNEQKNAVVTQFGRVVKVNTAGFYFKAPWQSVKKVDVTTHGTGIGYVVSATGQNITDTDNGIMITADFNLLNIDFYLEYRVTDPVAYLYNSEEPEQILSNIALANIRTVVSNYKVDEAMTTGKSQIQADVKEAMMRELEIHNIGLSVVNITVQDSAPPTEEISAAFKAVETAKQKADTAMNEALQYQNQKTPEAEANADAIIRKANAYKEARIAEATGQVERFLKMYEEYKKYPLITKRRLFYEKMEEILPGLKVIITSGDTQTLLPLDSLVNISNTTNNTSSGNYEDDYDEED
ncbi:MAG: FtsH protease activity modulator HflK [Lachnospiraceae bacterium]|nr:FtsH protease activity modulator HflK [Lachnospiraceae bacterium]MBR4795363.1 FtsH protease activity modulator HflK [Lachnospiraceae bacterium]MBR5789884.1 FtsH protease activity modulator HflK [Lachnospiraceae bacterium]